MRRLWLLGLVPLWATVVVATILAQGRSTSVPTRRGDAAEFARSLLRALNDSDRASAAMPFDSVVRTAWNYVPMVRKGVPLSRLSAEQRHMVDDLLRTALSEGGFTTAHRILSHETILRAIEEAEGRTDAFRRDPGRYYAGVFGAPSSDSPWGWRFEGHHLSVNVTRVPGASQAVAPLFMGANPARVPSGPHAGLRILAAEEDLARELVRMFPAERRSRAILSDKTFGDIVTRNDPNAKPLELEGLAVADMAPQERAHVRKLLELYAARMTLKAARDQLARIDQAGFEKLHFGWAGSLEVGKAHYYRIHGPTVLIEYDNTQTNANHIHTVWRDLERDFGGDLLRAHYAKQRDHR